MAGIFINYRKDDSVYLAESLDRRLREVFGDERVFLDSSNLRPGIEFPDEIRRRLDESTVLLALIGDSWLNTEDAEGRRRIDDLNDWVRLEIRSALDRKITVIPVLLDGVRLPKTEELPEDIAGIKVRGYFDVRRRHSQDDISVLIKELKRHIPTRPKPRRKGRGSGDRSRVVISGGRNRFDGPVSGRDTNGW